MTPQELRRYADEYLLETDEKARPLQEKINEAFVKMYAADPRLERITGSKEWWTKSQLGAFTAGFVRGMEHHATKIDLEILKTIMRF